MGKIQSVAHSVFICIHKNLALLFKIRYKLVKSGFKLQSVKDHIHTICFDDVSQCLLSILKGELIFLFLLKLSTAERTAYDDTGTSVGFPLTAAMFTLHFSSPPSVEFQKQTLSSF